VTLYSVTLARTIWLPDDGLRAETCRSVFNVLMCKFYKFYICVAVGVIIVWVAGFFFFSYVFFNSVLRLRFIHRSLFLSSFETHFFSSIQFYLSQSIQVLFGKQFKIHPSLFLCRCIHYSTSDNQHEGPAGLDRTCLWGTYTKFWL